MAYKVERNNGTGHKVTKLKALPLELKEANAFVEKLHRHHAPVHRDKFRFGAIDDNGEMHGIIQLARPVSRKLDDGITIEVVRCCTDGTKNTCSFLYARAARIAKEMGYKKIITYILKSEHGVSLKAAGWELENDCCGGGSWDTPSRPRDLVSPEINLFSAIKAKYPTEKKQRWIKNL
jgi:hypothetical protein